METTQTHPDRAWAQKVFTTSFIGLRSQGFARSVSMIWGDVGCAYRSPQPDGTVRRCGIGWLIPDSRYHPRMDEGECATIDVFRNGLGDEFLPITPDRESFLHALQRAHDQALDPINMLVKLYTLARKYHLIVPPPLKAAP